MRARLEKRLEELRAEYELGQQQLSELESQANGLRSTLLRISGAIQVLEEELGAPRAAGDGVAGDSVAEDGAAPEPRSGAALPG